MAFAMKADVALEPGETVGHLDRDGHLGAHLTRRRVSPGTRWISRRADRLRHQRRGEPDERQPATRASRARRRRTRRGSGSSGPSRRRTVRAPLPEHAVRRAAPVLDQLARGAVDALDDLVADVDPVAGQGAQDVLGEPAAAQDRPRRSARRAPGRRCAPPASGRRGARSRAAGARCSGTSPARPTWQTTGGIAGIVRSTYDASAGSRRGSTATTTTSASTSPAAVRTPTARPSRTTRSSTATPVSTVTRAGRQPVGQRRREHRRAARRRSTRRSAARGRPRRPPRRARCAGRGRR